MIYWDTIAWDCPGISLEVTGVLIDAAQGGLVPHPLEPDMDEEAQRHVPFEALTAITCTSCHAGFTNWALFQDRLRHSRPHDRKAESPARLRAEPGRTS